MYPQIRSQRRGDGEGEGDGDKEVRGREDNREERREKCVCVWQENMENGVLGLREVECN